MATLIFSDLLKEIRERKISNKELGIEFEKLIAYYMQNEPIYKDRFSEIYLWMEWPDRDDKDTGIDLVAKERNTDGYCAIQCKCFASEKTLSKGDIDSFFTASGRYPFTSRIIVSTTENWSQPARKALEKQQIPVTCLGVCDLNNSSIHWGKFSRRYNYELIFEAAKKGDAKAQNTLGEIYEDGIGTSINYEKAAEWYNAAANQDYADGQFNLGWLFYKGKGVHKDYEKAFKYFYKAAKQGHVRGKYHTGLMYKKGQGIPKNYKEAFHLLNEAAEQYDTDAQFQVGLAYEEGWIIKDIDKAIVWYERSAGNAIKKNVDAMAKLGLINYNSNNIKEGVMWMRLAADAGHKISQHRLGLIYESGISGIIRMHIQTAFNWYRKAAEQGYAKSQYKLGNMYRFSEVIPRNDKEAVEWYQKAAEQDHAEAQIELGNMYQDGYGIRKNYEKAVEWYRKAAEQGNPDGQFNLAEMYEKGEGVSQSFREALLLYLKAAEQGDSEAKKKVFEVLKNHFGYMKAIKYSLFGIFPKTEIWKIN